MSIRQWLGYTHQLFRSQAQDIGYRSVRYANGVYVAVGHQKGFPFGVYPTVGAAVTCAGCSWSADGINWTDSRLPFTGTSMCYQDAQYDGTGRWMAGAGEYLTASRRTYIAFSTDNAKTWSAPTLYGNDEIRALHGSFGKHFLATVNAPLGVPQAQERVFVNGVQNIFRNMQIDWLGGAAATTASDYIVFPSAWTSRVWNAGVITENGAWTGWFNGIDRGNAGTWYTLYDASFGLLNQFWVLASDTTTSVGQRGRAIWNASGGGSNWTRTATLPFVAGSKGPYYKLAYARDIGVMAAIGDGIMQVTKDGTNWTEIQIPAGAWRGVASNGTDFVCVSETGERLKVSGLGVSARMP